ncbi:hypothetical protein ACI2K6_12615 [Microbacterium sp. NPDC006705]|uniref:hypothetical protein n=1 Tax=Microbacterium sp. NPDC006705 TaxID=3364181 RepID=UPI00384AA611
MDADTSRRYHAFADWARGSSPLYAEPATTSSPSGSRSWASGAASRISSSPRRDGPAADSGRSPLGASG